MGRIILYRFEKNHSRQNKLKSSIRFRQGALCNFWGRDGLVLMLSYSCMCLVLNTVYRKRSPLFANLWFYSRQNGKRVVERDAGLAWDLWSVIISTQYQIPIPQRVYSGEFETVVCAQLKVWGEIYQPQTLRRLNCSLAAGNSSHLDNAGVDLLACILV